jgi:hypothetical protein
MRMYALESVLSAIHLIRKSLSVWASLGLCEFKTRSTLPATTTPLPQKLGYRTPHTDQYVEDTQISRGVFEKVSVQTHPCD